MAEIKEISDLLEFGVIPAIYLLIKLLQSLYDLKRELYKNDVLPDRGAKGKRY